MSLPLEVKLLQILREGPLPPSELAAALSLSGEGLTAIIQQLGALGFDIPQHPLLGYTLKQCPDQLEHLDILSQLARPWIERTEILTSTTSTNSVAMECGARGEPGPVAFFAEHQTAGRGRFGRVWESKAGEGIWMSLLLRPPGRPQEWPRLTSAAALAVVQSIEEHTGLQTHIKWPNDVIISERKVAGILAESASDSAGKPFVVLGIGINVNQTAFPKELSPIATSLQMLSGKAWNRNALAAQLLNCLEPLLASLHLDFTDTLTEIKKRSSVLGKSLSLYAGNAQASGKAVDLDSEGRLILLLEDGTLQSFAAGEVSLKPSA